MWSEFCDAFVVAFENITNSERVRRKLCNLKQIGRATGYVPLYRELQFRLPSMMEEGDNSVFVSRLKPHLAGQVGAHTHDDLSTTQAMAECLDHYTTGTKGDSSLGGGSGITGGQSSGRGARGGVA